MIFSSSKRSDKSGSSKDGIPVKELATFSASLIKPSL